MFQITGTPYWPSIAGTVIKERKVDLTYIRLGSQVYLFCFIMKWKRIERIACVESIYIDWKLNQFASSDIGCSWTIHNFPADNWCIILGTRGDCLHDRARESERSLFTVLACTCIGNLCIYSSLESARVLLCGDAVDDNALAAWIFYLFKCFLTYHSKFVLPLAGQVAGKLLLTTAKPFTRIDGCLTNLDFSWYSTTHQREHDQDSDSICIK